MSFTDNRHDMANQMSAISWTLVMLEFMLVKELVAKGSK
jgi:hypothetical protein